MKTSNEAFLNHFFLFIYSSLLRLSAVESVDSTCKPQSLKKVGRSTGLFCITLLLGQVWAEDIKNSLKIIQAGSLL